jgi:hypothetical protein
MNASRTFGITIVIAMVGVIALPQVTQTNSSKDANRPADTNSQGGQDKVRETVITLRTTDATVDLHRSFSSDERFFVAPIPRFRPLDQSPESIAQVTRDASDGRVPVQMSVDIVRPKIRKELAELLRAEGYHVTESGINNLETNSIRIGLFSKGDRDYYDATDFVLNNPQAGAELLAVSLDVAANRAKEFVQMVNAGRMTFEFSYSFNKVTVDSRIESLKASTLINTESVRNLAQRGAEVMTAKQMAEVANGIKREIESKVILGFGKVEPESMSLERLIQLFSVGKLVEMTDAQLTALDDKARSQVGLGVDAKEFQPFKYQRKIVDTLAKDGDIKQHKKQYANLYKSEKESLRISAKAKGGTPFFKASGSVDYSQDKEKALSEGNLSDDEFRNHMESYHGLEYTDQGVLERGVELCDVQKLRSQGETEVVSVTIKPVLGAGLRSLTLSPSRATTVLDVDRYGLIQQHIKELKSLNAQHASAIKELKETTEMVGYNRGLNNNKVPYFRMDNGSVILFENDRIELQDHAGTRIGVLPFKK